jgi:hypothetical protein
MDLLLVNIPGSNSCVVLVEFEFELISLLHVSFGLDFVDMKKAAEAIKDIISLKQHSQLPLLVF